MDLPKFDIYFLVNRQVNSMYIPSTEIKLNKLKLGKCMAGKILLI